MSMNVAQKLHIMDEIRQTNAQRVAEWIAEGKLTVSPAEAAPILGHKNAYGLNVAAKKGNFPRNAYFFSGRNMRIMVSYLADIVRGIAS